MNTKKITALALAALMAAGSTATAFADAADKDKALTFGSKGNLYGEDDGVIVKDDDNKFNPGDTIYVQLKADSNATDKEIDRMKVYADWKVGGDHVKSVDILYKKGSEVKKVTVGDQEIEAANVASLNAAVLEAYKGNKGTVVSTINGEFEEKSNGFTLNGEYIENIDGLLAKLNYTQKKNFKYDNNYYVDSEANVVKILTAKGYKLADKSVTYKTDDTIAQGYGTLNNGSGANEFTDISKLYVDGTHFVDLKTVTNLTQLFAGEGTLSLGITENNNGYQKGEEAFADKTKAEDAAKAEQGVAVVDASHMVYVDKAANTTVIAASKDKAVDWAIAKIIKGASVADSNAYTYWVEIQTKDSNSTKELDVAGTLYLGTSKNKAEDKNNEAGIDFTLSNRVSDYNKPGIVEDDYTFEADKNGAVKFSDDAEEVTLYFGSKEDAWFTFNAKGQSALNFGYTLKFNKEIADLFPKANIDFISWNAEPTTNRTGDLYITAEEDTFLYEVTENGIKEVKGAKYDENEGAWHLRTRKLTSYAVSDIELDTTVKVEGKDEASSNSSTSSKPNGGKENPDTGR